MPTSNDYDIIVIGSGIGGLTAAGLLARVAHKRVLVLEKHLEPGGLTHSFRRDGASWDVGVHYIGQMGEHSPNRLLFDYLSAGKLQWNPMPDAFERFVYPGMDFRVPSDAGRYQQALIEAFPDERAAIEKYFRDLRRAARWAGWHFMQDMVPGFFVPVLRLLRRFDQRFGAQTTGDYLKQHIRSPALRALLGTQWGDYGLPPARSPFALHATIVTHYLQGAWFPAGGSAQIARTIETVLEKHGGAVRVGQEVTAIALNEQGQACGVQVTDHRGPKPQTRLFKAPVIISAIGARPTYERLLPTDGPIDEHTAALRRQIQTLGHGLSAVVLYLRLNTDPRQLGIEGENIWINTSLGHDDIDSATHDLLHGHARHLYVSFPSIKAGHTQAHTVEIIAFVNPKAFERWANTTHRQRGEAYEALKTTISDGMLSVADKVLPGLRAAVTYQELSTPLTVEHYTGHAHGAFYGLPATPERFLGEPIRARTPIDGLFLAGQDACTLGIMGAMMGGMAAACQVLGPARGYPMIQKAIRDDAAKRQTEPLTSSTIVTPTVADPRRANQSPTQANDAGHDAQQNASASSTPHLTTNKGQLATLPEQAALLSENKYHATLISRAALTASIWQVQFSLQGRVDAFTAGQFARLHVGQHHWRDYSIACLQPDPNNPDQSRLTLLVSTRTGGEGSRFIEHAPLGTTTQVELPLGQYTLAENSHRKIFVATGTGLAPFLPMLASLNETGLRQATLIFGCRTAEDDLTTKLPDAPPLPGTIIRCYSRMHGTGSGETLLHGRVTDALNTLSFTPDDTDFYLCGASSMVADCRALLAKRGARHVWVEMY
ncbi:MAG: FAD-dependent oxidoreductase [Lautropia sp.]|nr:FAD-dependent oxidoreductase [Lautropia sp.]